jgi:hypothetical protein
MNQKTNEILIDYVDGNLNPEDRSRIEKMIRQDPTTAEDLEYLKLAIDTVRLNAIREKVSEVRSVQQSVQQDASQKKQRVIRNFYKTVLRIAAILIFLLSSALMYKIITVTNQSVFNKQFIPFELTNTRGAQIRDTEAEAYSNKNWNEVLRIFQEEKASTNKSRFLAAMAELQLNHFSKAEVLFEGILATSTEDRSFNEEAEYYLSLTYLVNNKVHKGIEMMNKIKADKNHPYYPLASHFSSIDMKIIELKK